MAKPQFERWGSFGSSVPEVPEVWFRGFDALRRRRAAPRTATLNPARYFNVQQTHGSVATGKAADLVLLDANPLDEIANVRRIHAVIRAGRLLDKKELDTQLTQVNSAAQQQ